MQVAMFCAGFAAGAFCAAFLALIGAIVVAAAGWRLAKAIERSGLDVHLRPSAVEELPNT